MMQKIEKGLSVEEIQAIDVNCEYLGIKRLMLMENAGAEVSRIILEMIKPKKCITIVAGSGNKGGDGFVAARHLSRLGIEIIVILIGRPESIRSEEAKINWKIINELKSSIKTIVIEDTSQIDSIKELLTKSEVIVDALLGTGIRGLVKPPASEIIKIINHARECGAKIVSIDVPSGIDPNNGTPLGVAVKADLTITHHKPKIGLMTKDGTEYAGEIIVSNIGIPPEVELFAGPGDVIINIKRRRETSHKGDFGRIIVIGGSIEYTGAPALTALAALRTGADISIIITPSKIANAIRSFSPNLIVKEYEGEYLNTKGLKIIEKEIEKADVVAIGPGLSSTQEVLDNAMEVFKMAAEKGKNLVIDADALKAYAKNPSIVKGTRTIVTPHTGEFKIVTGITLPNEEGEGWKDRIPIVMNEARKLEVTILLKSHYDIISDGIKVKVNRTGNPGMTVGGTGDVLTGVTSTFLAWTNNTFRSAVAAAFINGLAGDIAVSEKGYHITATDVVEKIPEAFKIVEKYV
ncbi:MAG: NAD(P)H-hydrate dehydratase [Candidatus Methanomethylicia archaeon]